MDKLASMDIESLKAFLVVAEQRSFSSAAHALHLTQPAISKRIASLESQLGYQLFDRIGRNIQLTEAGQVLLPRARHILAEMEETRRAIADLSGEVIGDLRVATSHHVGLHRLPPLLREFASRYPRVNLQFDFLDSEKAHERVIRGDCELAVVTLAPKAPENLKLEVVWHDPLVFVTGKEHGFSDTQVTLQQLSHEPAILPDLNTFTGRLVKSCFDRQRLNLRLSMATNYLETIKMMVSVGLGWSVLPDSLVDSQLCRLDVAGVKLSRQLGVVTHEKRSLSNAARAFYALLCAENSNYLKG
jgi:DNA-binding transcriptional LysR family regulator